MSKRKDLQPLSLDEQDFYSKGEVQFTNVDEGDGIEGVNSRAEDAVEDYQWGPKWLPGKNIEGSSGPSDG